MNHWFLLLKYFDFIYESDIKRDIDSLNSQKRRRTECLAIPTENRNTVRGSEFALYILYHFQKVKSDVKLHRCRRFGRLASTDRSVGHGRYRRSVRFHLRDNTVDIDGRFGYTYGELRVGSVHSTQKLVDIDHIGRFIQKKIGRRSISTVQVDIHSKQPQKSADIEFVYPYFTMSTDEKNCLSHLLLITLNQFKRISLNNMYTHRDHDGLGQECVKMVFILIKLVPVITLVATTSKDFVRVCRSTAVVTGLTFRCRGRPQPLALPDLSLSVNLNNFWIYLTKKQKGTYLWSQQ